MAQNPLASAVAVILGLTAVVAIIAAATSGRSSNPVILLGGVVTVGHVFVAAGVKLLGAYVL